MRFFLVICLWVVFVGGLKLYTWQRDSGTAQAVSTPVQLERLQGDWVLELTPTFSAEDDPFALQVDDKQTVPIEARLNAQPLALHDIAINRGQVIRVENIAELQPGHNEIFIKASPPVSESDKNHGIRVRILDGENVLADQTIWSSSGSLVLGSISFELKQQGEDGHDH